MHLIIYTQTSNPVPAVFDGTPCTLQPNSSISVMPISGTIGGNSLEGLNYATVLVGDGGSIVTYHHYSPGESFGLGFGLGCGFLAFVLCLSITKLISKHSPDF